MSPVGPFTAGQLLAGRFRIVAPVAAGAVGTVWRAVDEQLQRPVAIKALHDHLALDAGLRRRFEREARAAAAVRSEHVVAVWDVVRHDERDLLILELVDGPSLDRVLRQHDPLDPLVVASIGAQLAAALAAIHAVGLVHRDVKPSNLLLTSDGRIKLTDFGVVRTLEATAGLTMTGAGLGSPAYLAPEQLDGQPADARADVYGAGLVLWEALVGRPAFDGDTPAATAMMRLQRVPEAPGTHRPDIPPELDRLVVRATARDPADRPMDGAALARALRPLVGPRRESLTAGLVVG